MDLNAEEERGKNQYQKEFLLGAQYLKFLRTHNLVIDQGLLEISTKLLKQF